MSTLFKIRLLLFLLALGFAVTALTIHVTYNKDEILEYDAKTIEANLQKKELYITRFLNNKANFNSLRRIHENPEQAAAIIKEFRNKQSIYLHTYYNHQLTFWGGNRIAPNTDAGLREGSNRIKTQNGWYEAIKKSAGNFSVVGIIPIKAEYPFQNKFLRNAFAPDLIKENNLDVAGHDSKKTYNIKNIEGQFIISVKLKSPIISSYYLKLELLMVVLAFLFATIFVNYLCVMIATKGYQKTAIGAFFLYFLTLRLISLQFPVLDTYFNISIFNPSHFSDGFLYRSLGDLVLNAFFTSWFLCFMYSYRNQIKLTREHIPQAVGIVIFIVLGFIIYLTGNQQSDIFFNLITKSNINFNLTNILYLDSYSWIGILLMYIAAFNLYLLLETFLAVGKTLPLSDSTRLKTFLVGVLTILLFQVIFLDYNIYFLLFSILILTKGWAYYTNSDAYKFLIFLFVVLLFSIIASIKLSSFEFLKESGLRKIIAYKLESADDPNAVLLFFSIEQELIKDELLTDYFKNPPTDKVDLRDQLQKRYFDGYLSRYDFEAYTYRATDRLTPSDSSTINTYKKLVLAGAIKVSENFYRINNTFGVQHYFAIIPVKQGERVLGTLVLSLKTKTFTDPSTVPEILVDGKITIDRNLENYSFAFYLNDRLLNQNGNYIYNLVNNEFKGRENSFSFIEKNGYSHLVYRPKAKKVIVVSTPVSTWVMKLASVSFLFLVMIAFSVVIIVIHQGWVVMHDDELRTQRHKWTYLLSRNRILYRTRIQASLVAAIVLTLMIVGLITYLSISRQFSTQLKDDVIRKINQISNGLEKNKMFNEVSLPDNDGALHSFADINATDINLFDLQGRLVFTTQNKIYENGLAEPRMNAYAFVYMSKYQRSEFLNEEKIGGMSFIAAYKPIRNSRNETIGYLSLPYFSNEAEYDKRIGQYLNTLINVYALVLVVIALFAIFLANKITYPLTLVGKSLSEIKIDGKNEPIEWKSNDEIGSLIKEYNNMIVALEDSAKKLARSERESAWREMAKQVAHEIKNPLTPLKLGVQLLEKSWVENDPNFNKKFAKFSKSFIEQIESLSLIASEFSNFAKLPDAPFERINITDIIEKSIDSFALSGMEFTHPDQPVYVNGSKDHLLRIFNNLIKNAMEAGNDGAETIISIQLSVNGQVAEIYVNDNGKGIPEELSDKIFNPNFTTKSSGTGLGLAFVKQAVENMLGTIRFETSAGLGTSFHITLPLA